MAAGVPDVRAGASQAAVSLVTVARVLMILVTSCLPLPPTTSALGFQSQPPWAPQIYVRFPSWRSHPVVWQTGRAGRSI